MLVADVYEYDVRSLTPRWKCNRGNENARTFVRAICSMSTLRARDARDLAARRQTTGEAHKPA